MNVLITGACGVTSRSVVRSLMLSDYFKNCEYIGTDVCQNLYGMYEGLYKKVYKVPYSKDFNYRKVMESIIRNEKIDAAIIIPEPEVLYWAEHPFFNVKYLSPPPKFARIALSKKRLFEALNGSGLIPFYQIANRDLIRLNKQNIVLKYPFWVRDYSDGTTSGKGSFLAQDFEQLKAWLLINSGIDTFMFSEYLIGRNFGCFLLYDKGKLIKSGTAERISYFNGKVSVSGITGNTAVGKLHNIPKVFEISKLAVEKVCYHTGESMNGLVVVDLKENVQQVLYVTEINIRHVAFTSSFANAGFNFAEYQLLCALDMRLNLSKEIEQVFPKNNLILRDIDGMPLYIADYEPIEIGNARYF